MRNGRHRTFRRSNGRRLPLLVSAALLAILWGPAHVSRVGPTFAQSPQPADLSPVLFGDRQTLRLFRTAKELLSEDRLADAISCLGPLLESEDALLPPEDRETSSATLRSLRHATYELIASLSDRAYQTFEEEYGPAAQAKLEAALQANDWNAVSDIAGRYYHTTAGYEATFLLAFRHLDSGNALAAAILFDRLRLTCRTAAEYEPALSVWTALAWYRAGESGKVDEVLADAVERYEGRPLRLGGKEIEWFSDADEARRWLEDRIVTDPGVTKVIRGYAMFRGDPSRNASVEAGDPLLLACWKVPTVVDAETERRLAALRLQGDLTTRFASAVPLAIGNKVVARTARGIVAIDLATGKRLWHTADDRTWLALHGAASAARNSSASRSLDVLLARLTTNQTYGRLAADEKLLYAVEDSDVSRVPNMTAAVPFGAIAVRRQAEGEVDANRLAAYDLETGKLRWHVGGDSQLLNLPLEGTDFLGPPLPHEDELYVMGRKGPDAYLFVLEAETGALIWQQQLAVLQDLGVADLLAAGCGLSPVYSEGILICRVSPGVVVSLDVTTRSLMWAYIPPSRRGEEAGSPFAPRLIGGRVVVQSPTGRSEILDYTPIISRNRVLLPIASTGGVVCLDLMTGEQVWEYKNPPACLFIGCATDHTVFLITKTGTVVLSMDDGSVVRENAVFRPDTMEPAGFGYFNGAEYYLPLTSGDVAVFDVETGDLKRRLIPPAAQRLGNLVVHNGKVVSQTVDAVEAFYEAEAIRREIAERLQTNPQDGRAWFARTVLALQEHRVDDAQKALSGFLAAEAPSALKREMALMILNGAQRDFPQFEKYLEEFRSLLTQPEEQIAFELVVADGETGLGRYESAWRRYLAVARRILDEGDRTLEPSPGVRRSAAGWVGRGLEALVPQCDQRLRERMEQQVGEVLAAADTDNETLVTAAARCFPVFDAVVQPWLLDAARGLVEQPPGEEKRLVGRQLLTNLAESEDVFVRAEACLLLAKTDDFQQAIAHHLDCAAQSIQDAEAVDPERAQTLTRWLAGYRDTQIGEETESAWPIGKIEVVKVSKAGNPELFNTYRIAIEEDFSPYAEDWALDVLRTASAGYRIVDARGRVLRDLTGIEEQRLRQVDQSRLRSWIIGDVLLVDTGFLCAAFNLQHDSPQIPLWIDQGVTATIDDNSLGIPSNMPFVQHTTAIADGRTVIFRIGNTLRARDAATGHVLWERTGVPAGRLLTACSEFVACQTEGSNPETILYSTNDGAELARRDFDRTRPVLRSLGRYLLRTQNGATAFRITYEDVKDERVVQEFVVPRDAGLPNPMTAVLSGGRVGIYEPHNGRWRLVHMPTGTVLCDAKLNPHKTPVSINIFDNGAEYHIVLGFRDPSSEPAPIVSPIGPFRSMRCISLSQAEVYRIAKDGKQLWEKPAVIENTYLPLDQPIDSPVLVFGGLFWKKTGAVRTYQTRVQAIDKRTGKLVLDTWHNNMSQYFNIESVPEEDAVKIALQQAVVTLRFTDRADTPADDDKVDPKRIIRTLFW
ncbi:outer membrane protein assembly factor BamB family protein [Thermostilla marina]